MNASPLDTSSSSIFVDMYIGPVFDAEKYLELERKLFKVEPRPIPGFERVEPETESNPTIMDGFIEKATRFSCWLDDVLKAPFLAFSRSYNSSANSRSKSSGSAKTIHHDTPTITPPPKVYKDKTMGSRRHSLKPARENIVRNEVPKSTQKTIVSPAHFKKDSVIKNGHVQGLIKKYEELSNVSGASSSVNTHKKSVSASFGVKVGRTVKKGSSPAVVQGNMKKEGPIRQTPNVPKIVNAPGRVASASMLVARRKEKQTAGKSDRLVRLLEDDNGLAVGDTNSHFSSSRERHNVGSGGRSPRIV